MFNPYQPYMNNQQIVRVNGENGARAYQMMPNSSVLLLDETSPRLFLAQTDGAGYKTISAYKLEPYEEEPKTDIQSLVARIDTLERKLNNAQSNSSINRNKQQKEHNEGKSGTD